MGEKIAEEGRKKMPEQNRRIKFQPPLSFTLLLAGRSAYLYVNSGVPGGGYDFTDTVPNRYAAISYPFQLRMLTASECGNGAKAKRSAIRHRPELGLQIVPNPNREHFGLAYQLPHRARPEITIYNLQGKAVYRDTAPAWEAAGSHRRDLELDHLAGGLYLVSLQTANGHTTVRMGVID
ncbi:MAG: T9SS type A sorting domain-containing protein [Bacteroidota bacterium]